MSEVFNDSCGLPVGAGGLLRGRGGYMMGIDATALDRLEFGFDEYPVLEKRVRELRAPNNPITLTKKQQEFQKKDNAEGF